MVKYALYLLFMELTYSQLFYVRNWLKLAQQTCLSSAEFANVYRNSNDNYRIY
jgi:hypothetical protein